MTEAQTKTGINTVKDQLVCDWTVLANERTLPASIRTAIGLLAAGGMLVKLFPDNRALEIAGIGLLFLGGVALAMGIWRFASIAGKLCKIAQNLDYQGDVKQ